VLRALGGLPPAERGARASASQAPA
jgi:hypothetical protein